jgi:copper chaperone
MQSFEIPAISCGHCARAVTEAVHAADPAAQVQVDVASKRVSVESQVPREAIVAQLAEAGYPPA